MGEVADIILQEQLMNMCCHQLQVFRNKRKYSSSRELVTIVEMFVEVHTQGAAFMKPKTTVSAKKSTPIQSQSP